MNRLSIKPVIAAGIGLATALFAVTAAADYRITAFGDTKAYTALIKMDVAAAKATFENSELAQMTFTEANNLCVTEVLSKEYAEAIVACEAALEKVKYDPYVSATSEKSAKASIYSNMAVAKALSGDMSGAAADVEASLLFNSRDVNALSNYELIVDETAVMDVAQN